MANYVQIGDKIFLEIDPKEMNNTPSVSKPKKAKKKAKPVTKYEYWGFFIVIGLLIIAWAYNIMATEYNMPQGETKDTMNTTAQLKKATR